MWLFFSIFFSFMALTQIEKKRHFNICKKFSEAQAFFHKQRYFSIQPQCCSIFSWIKLQMLLRCCLINVSIFILRHFLYFLYLCPYLDLDLFLSHLCDLFFIFVFILTMINHIIPSKQGHLFCFRILWIFHITFGWWLAKVQSKGFA